MSDWRTIDSAPKDGTSVLVYIPAKHLPQNNAPSSRMKWFTRRIIESRWMSMPSDTKSRTLGNHARELREKFGGYWSCDHGGVVPLRGAPTHWMPLPEPPS